MSVAFAAEVAIASKGVTIVAFAREEEKGKETEEKKEKEDKLKSLPASVNSHILSCPRLNNSSSQSAALSAGYHPKPFNPPDVI